MAEYNFLFINKIKNHKLEIDSNLKMLCDKVMLINLELDKIYKKKFNENVRFEKYFKGISNSETFRNLDLHILTVYDLTKSDLKIRWVLELLNEIFPNITDLDHKFLNESMYKKFIFPQLLSETIKEEFIPEISNRNINDVVFYNTVKFKKNPFNKKNAHIINYKNFIEKKIVNIINSGSNFSNDKAVSSASTYINGRTL